MASAAPVPDSSKQSIVYIPHNTTDKNHHLAGTITLIAIAAIVLAGFTFLALKGYAFNGFKIPGLLHQLKDITSWIVMGGGVAISSIIIGKALTPANHCWLQTIGLKKPPSSPLTSVDQPTSTNPSSSGKTTAIAGYPHYRFVTDKPVNLTAFKTAPMGNFDKLGPDATFKIFTFLSPQDLANINSTCRKFWSIVHEDERWKNLCIQTNSLISPFYAPPQSYLNQFYSGNIFCIPNKKGDGILPLEARALRHYGMRPSALALSYTRPFAASTHLSLREEESLASNGCDIHLWNYETEQPLTVFCGHQQAVEHLVFADDVDALISSSERTICLWKIMDTYSIDPLKRTTEDHPLQQLQTETPIYSLCYGGKGIFFTGHSDTIQSWLIDKDGFKKMQLLSGLDGPVTSLTSLCTLRRKNDSTHLETELSPLYLLGTTRASHPGKNNMILWKREWIEKALFEVAASAKYSPSSQIRHFSSCMQFEKNGEPVIFTTNESAVCSLQIFHLRQGEFVFLPNTIYYDKPNTIWLHKARVNFHLHDKTLIMTDDSGNFALCSLPPNYSDYYPKIYSPNWAKMKGIPSSGHHLRPPVITNVFFRGNKLFITSPNASQITAFNAPIL